jgi:hypothetical protein
MLCCPRETSPRSFHSPRSVPQVARYREVALRGSLPEPRRPGVIHGVTPPGSVLIPIPPGVTPPGSAHIPIPPGETPPRSVLIPIPTWCDPFGGSASRRPPGSALSDRHSGNIVGFKGFLCVSAKIRRRRIWHLRVEDGERHGLSQALNPQMTKGLSPWR